jgi:hypothetical protein
MVKPEQIGWQIDIDAINGHGSGRNSKMAMFSGDA